MATALKIRRSGIERIFKKTPLRSWMDEQHHSSLTYKKEFKGLSSCGWTTEDFCRESWHRGLDVRIGTLMKWCAGAKPRHFIAHELKKAFPSIRF